MTEFDFLLLLLWQGVFLLGYLAVFVTLWRDLYSRHIAPGLAAGVLLIFLCSVGFTGLLYQYFGCDPLVLYVLLACYGAGLAVWLGRLLWRHRREMVSRVLALLAADLAAVLFITLASRLGDPTRGGLQLVPLLDIIQSARNGLVHPLEHALLNALLFVPTGCLVAQLGPSGVPSGPVRHQRCPFQRPGGRRRRPAGPVSAPGCAVEDGGLIPIFSSPGGRKGSRALLCPLP